MSVAPEMLDEEEETRSVTARDTKAHLLQGDFSAQHLNHLSTTMNNFFELGSSSLLVE